jgi:hypothetical protein
MKNALSEKRAFWRMPLFGILMLVLSTQACVGKFLSTLLSTENAQFRILEVVPVANTKILVGFNKPLDYEKGALTLSNYSIPGLNPISVTKGAETNQVYLFLDPNAPDNERMKRQYYTLSVSGIKNLYLDDLLPGDENRTKQFLGARWLRATCLDDAGTFTCPSSGTTLAADVTVTVRGDYARGQNYRWRLYNVTTSSEQFALSVPTPVANTFVIPNTIPSPADYRIDILIQDEAGAWQPENDPTQIFFSVDNTSVSDVGLSNVPAALTSSTVTNISVAYRNCVEAGFPNGYAAPCYSSASPVSAQIPASYKYRVGTKAGTVPADCNDENSVYTFGAWSATRSTNLPINEILSTNQCYTIQVVAADNVGNFQCNTAVADTTAGACANPAGPGDGSISDFFDNDTNGDPSVVGNKAFQQVRFLLDTTAPTAAFVTNTLPVATTSATSFAVAVDGTGLSKYQYRVIGTGFSGTWSTDKDPATDLISAAGLINGSYRIEIVGKDAAGNYQATASATGYDFVVDTTAPTATLASQGTCTGAAGVTTAPDNGLPRNPTRFNCHNIRVNNVTFYKYTIVTGNSCPTATGDYDVNGQKISASEYIAADTTAWVNGSDYSICVIGSNNGALYQGTSASAVTRHTFRYDTTPPTSQVVTWISPALNLAGQSTVNTDVNVQIGKAAAENLVGYKGTIVTGVCPTSAAMVADNATYPERSPETPLQATGLAAGTVRICFIGRDAAGNYEATTQSVTYTVFAPPAPNDGVAGIDDLYANTFDFTWVTGAGIPTGTQEIRIRVCKDAACTEPLPGMQNGVVVCNSVGTCDVTSSYTLNTGCAGLSCIKQLNGATYYAQLKVKDSVGVESSFGTASTGKRITGAVSGIVRDTNNNPIAGATVRFFADPLCATTQIGADATSAGDGSFNLTLAGGYAVPIKLATSGYCLRVSTVGPVREGTKTYIEANAGAITNAGNIYAVSTTGKGCMIGAVVDGSNGSQLLLSNATFTLKDFQSTTLASTPNLDPDGKQFAFPASCVTSWGAAPYNAPTYDHTGAGLNAGVYSLQIVIPGYYTINETGIAIQDVTTTNLGYLPMVGTFASGSKQIKVILTWGNQTKDLDLHVVGPSSGIDCQPYNEAAIQNAAGSKFHVSFQQRYCAETGTTAPTGSTSLAVDDSYEYGPEIVNFASGYVNGTYKFSVYNNDATALDWNVSRARIDIYAGDFYGGSGGLIKTILSTGSSTLRGWRPFKMTIAGVNNAFPPGGTLTIDDTTGVGYTNLSYGTGTFTCDGIRINGPSDGLTAGALPATGQSPRDPNLDCGLFLNGTTVAGGAGPLDW